MKYNYLKKSKIKIYIHCSVLVQYILLYLLSCSIIFSEGKLNFSANFLETQNEGELEKQIFKENVIIKKKSMHLYTDKAIYYPTLDEVILINNVRMYDLEDSLVCDSLVLFNKEHKNFKAFKDVIYYQKENQIRCQKLNYQELFNEGDKLIQISDNAEILDSLRIIKGDSIHIHYLNSLIDYIEIHNNGEIINNRYAKINYNSKMQLFEDNLSGKKIFVDFDNEAIKDINLYGMATTKLNAVKDTLLKGLNNASGDSIMINMQDDVIHRMQIKGGARGTFTPEKNNSSIDSTIEYSAEHIDYHINDEISYLYNQAYVNYDFTELNAGEIYVDWNNNFLEAKIKDSIYPSINGFGEKPTFGDRMIFDLVSKRGKIYKGRTEFNDGYYIGENIYQEEDEVFYVKESQFTTCDSDTPHYFFKSKDMKVIPNDRIIARPVVFYIQDLPIFSLPFAVFPNKNGNRISGWIMPSFGHRSSTGSYLEDLGYYYVPNDYSDYRILLDVQDRRGVLINHLIRYKRRAGKYWYNHYYDGRLEYDEKKYLEDENIDIKNLSNPNTSKFTTIKWRHKQSFDPTQNLIINYKYKSSIDPLESNFNERLDQNQTTSMGYNKRWERNSMTLGYEKYNDLYNPPPHSIDSQYKYKWFSGPRFSFSLPQRKLFGEGDKIKNDLYISYGLTYTKGKKTYTKFSCLDQDKDGLCDCEVRCDFIEDEETCNANSSNCSWESDVCINSDLSCELDIDIDDDGFCDDSIPPVENQSNDCEDLDGIDKDGDLIIDCYWGDERDPTDCDSCIGVTSDENCSNCFNELENTYYEDCEPKHCNSTQDYNNDGYCDNFIWSPNEEIDESSGGAKNKISLSLAHSFNWLTVSPRLSIIEDWVFNYTDFSNGEYIEKNELERRLTWNASLSLNTKIYGILPLNLGDINSIRHKMTPQITLSYSPDLRSDSKQIKDNGTTNGYDILSGTTASYLSEGSRKIRFSLSNTFQMKIDNQEKNEIKKIDFLSYNLTCSYGGSGDNENLFSLIDSKISFKKPNGGELLFVHMQHDMYDTEEKNKELLIEKGKSPKLKRLTAQMSSYFKIKGQNYNENLYNEEIEDTTFTDTTMHNSILYMDKYKPKINSNELWRSDLGVSIKGDYEYNVDDNKWKWDFNYFNLDTRTTLHLTKKWLLTYAVGINLIDMKMKSQSFKFYRELHCWEFMFTWWPDGFGKGFQLSINVKHPDLQDLRVRSSSPNKKFRN